MKSLPVNVVGAPRKKAGLETVPVVIRKADNQATLAMALIENMQREDLNPIETALGLKRLLKEFDLTQQAVADAVGRSRATVTNLLRLLKLPKPVQEWLHAGELSNGARSRNHHLARRRSVKSS